MSFIYKYLPPERKTYLSDGMLRFTPPSDLNDPYECLPGITDELVEEGLIQLEKRLSETPESFNELTRNERRIKVRHHKKSVQKTISDLKKDPTLLTDFFYNQATNNIDQSLGILSLSKRWNSSLMWSHYTKSHQGLCIGFSEKHDFFKATNAAAMQGDFTIEPVTYTDKRPLVTNKRPNKLESLEILHTKSLDWEYEQEIRAISVLKNATKTIDAKPYKISLFHVPHEAIGEIVVGLRANKEIIRSAKELAENLSIPVYKAYISQQSFDLDRELINA